MKKYLLAFLLLSMAVACGSNDKKENDPGGSTSFKATVDVMSYNMLFEHTVPPEIERQWVSRLPNITATILSIQPDIIGSQELLSWQVADICKGTGYKRVGKSLSGGVSDTDNSENECIFYNPVKIKCVESGDFWFNTHPDTPGLATGTTYNRKCTWGRFMDLESGRLFYLFNSHFYYETLSFREQCASVLVDRLSKTAPAGAAVILTGDFNADESESSIKSILSAGYRESRSEVSSPQGPSGSYYGFDMSKAPTALLDHVFINSGVKVNSYRIVDTQLTSGKIESDHLPVLVNLSF